MQAGNIYKKILHLVQNDINYILKKHEKQMNKTNNNNIHKLNKEVKTHEKTNTYLRTRACNPESLFVCVKSNLNIDYNFSYNQKQFLNQ